MENQATIEKQISKQFDKCDRVGETLLRCERRYRDAPWAVVFFDLSGNLPKSSDELGSYLDNTIAKSYFTSGTDLKWNHYLVFVAGKTDELSSEKQLIENDKNYARKFVIDEASLPSFLKGYKIVPEGASKPEDVFGRWAAALDGLGLQGIVDDKPRATLVEEYISKDMQPSDKGRKSGGGTKRDDPEDAIYRNSIEKLEIRSFLPLPTRRNFDFGRVNLVTGPNGVGKTSLLEAIEYLICGATKRALLQPIFGADIAAQFTGQKDLVGSTAGNETFRKRDLRWYGRNYDRGNKLAESFNRHNFFNSDAAVDLTHNEDEATFKESLSRLALGDEANRLWDRIVKTLVLFENEQRPIQNELLTSTLRLNKLIQDIELLRSPSQNVESLFKRVVKHFDDIGWKGIPKTVDDIHGEFQSTFQQVLEAIESLARVEWVESPLSIKRIRQEAARLRKALEELRSIQAQLTNLRKDQVEQELALSALQSKQRGLARLTSYFDSGVDLSFEQLDTFARSKMAKARIATQIGDLTTLELSERLLPLRVSDAISEWTENRAKVLKEIETIRLQISSTEGQVKKTVALLSELKTLAENLLEQDSTRTKCPVCHTEFESNAVLRSAANTEEDEALSSTGLVELRVKLNVARDALQTFERDLGILGRLRNLDTLLLSEGAEGSQTVSSVKIRAAAFLDEYRRLELEITATNDSISRLRDGGFTNEEFNSLLGEIPFKDELEISKSRDVRISLVKDMLRDVETKVTETERRLSKARQQLHDLNGVWLKQSKTLQPDTADDELILNLESRVQTLDSFISMLDAIKPLISLDSDLDLREFRIKLMVTSEALQKLVEIRDSEKARNTRLNELQGERKTVEPIVKRLTERGKRCSKAIDTLRRIVRDDSRESAVSEFLKSHKKRIGYLFERIHAPREFTGLSDDGLMLVTREGKKRALNEISSGQRSALALAIFLTLNGVSDRAPPLILMDDPVVYVDDLNTLAFFDSLRELALIDERQIFFATANSKLAALFERKFAFLGKTDFQSIPLARS